MTFDPKRLTSQNVTPYLREAKYSHGTDTIAAMQASTYFDTAYAALPKGTLLAMVGTQDGSPQAVNAVVTASSSAGVTIAVDESAAGAGVTGGGMIMSAQKVSSKGADAEVVRFVAPFKGRITSLDAVLNAALATGDGTVTAAIAGVGVTTGVITLTNAASAAGSKFSAVPTALNAFAKGDTITLTVGGASTATATCNLQVTLEETP